MNKKSKIIISEGLIVNNEAFSGANSAKLRVKFALFWLGILMKSVPITCSNRIMLGRILNSQFGAEVNPRLNPDNALEIRYESLKCNK